MGQEDKRMSEMTSRSQRSVGRANFTRRERLHLNLVAAGILLALALSTYLIGRTLLAMHLPSALGSAGIVFVVFWLGRILYGKDESGRATPWRGLLIGGVGAGLLAVSIGQTVTGRSSYNESIYMSLLLALCLGLLWQGWRKRSWCRIVLAAVCAGLLSYTKVAAYFTPILFLLFGTSFFFAFGFRHHGNNAS